MMGYGSLIFNKDLMFLFRFSDELWTARIGINLGAERIPHIY
jgi:hypothetical protein